MEVPPLLHVSVVHRLRVDRILCLIAVLVVCVIVDNKQLVQVEHVTHFAWMRVA